ncbi:uncharacterized protein [Elaeis guineensis]|uniref:uncharacterized protein n=1 Tax=Elaeis guineensis var. tenera TaxID=51953 RepID=UPI00057A9F22
MRRPMPVPMLICLILLFETFSSQVRSIDDGIKPGYLVSKGPNLEMHARKALGEITLDYDYGGPNPKHDPRKGKPGNGGKNP